MKKILYLVTKSEIGGAQKYALQLASNLKDYKVLVAAGKENGELFNKIPSISLKYLKRLPDPFTAFLAILEIRRILKKESPDILHLNSTTAGFLGSLASVGLKLKVIYTVHGWAFLEPGFKSKLYFLLEKLSSPLKDKFIVLSDFDKKQGLRITKKKKIVKIYNGLEKLSFLSREQARKALNLHQKEKIVGCVANFYKTKGLKYLVKANLKEKIVLIGDGPERKSLKKDNVILLGRKKDAYKYLKAFDVFCLPSVKEGFPFVILEALQAQVPIAATKVGALPEILEEKFLVKSESPEALKEKIEYLLKTKEAPKAKQDFSLEKTLKQTKNLYVLCSSSNTI